MKTRQLVFPDKLKCAVEEVEINEDLGHDEVLVRNSISLISAGTELAMYARTHRGFDVPEFTYASYPFYPGYATVGTIIKIGDDVNNLSEGDRVYHTGTHATYSRLKSARCFLLTSDLSDEKAVFCRPVTIAMTAPRLAPVNFGENVLIVGLGMIGNLCGQLYKQAGANVVAGADISVSRLAKAKECGFDFEFNLDRKTLLDWAEELKPYGAELVIEAVGLPETTDSCLKAVAEKGRVVLLGSARAKMEFDPYFDIHRKGVRVIGAHERSVAAGVRERDVSFIFNLLEKGRVKVEPLITHRMPFTDAKKAYDGLLNEKDKYLAVLLEYGDSPARNSI